MATVKPKTTATDNELTRAKAEKALAAGADPNFYIKHKNKHVRAKAQRKIDAMNAVLQAAVDANLTPVV